TRGFTWPRVGAQYVELGATLPATVVRRSPKPEQPRASSLPELRLDHLLRLTDDTGIVQHATFSVPARESGYCVDDNARALIVAVRPDRIQGSDPQTRTIVTRYLSYLHGPQQSAASLRNF